MADAFDELLKKILREHGALPPTPKRGGNLLENMVNSIPPGMLIPPAEVNPTSPAWKANPANPIQAYEDHMTQWEAQKQAERAAEAQRRATEEAQVRPNLVAGTHAEAGRRSGFSSAPPGARKFRDAVEIESAGFHGLDGTGPVDPAVEAAKKKAAAMAAFNKARAEADGALAEDQTKRRAAELSEVNPADDTLPGGITGTERTMREHEDAGKAYVYLHPTAPVGEIKRGQIGSADGMPQSHDQYTRPEQPGDVGLGTDEDLNAAANAGRFLSQDDPRMAAAMKRNAEERARRRAALEQKLAEERRAKEAAAAAARAGGVTLNPDER